MKTIFPLMLFLFFTTCKKEISPALVSEEIAGSAANTRKGKIDVCHKEGNGSFHTININSNALAAHVAHGDIVPDADGDGYTKVNPCGMGSQDDCNGNNAAVNLGAAEICFNNIDDNCNGQVDENCFVIGADYQGGKIAYILQPGDPGYVQGETHGLIAAASDQSTGAEWGCINKVIEGADGTALGTGNQNTIDIMAGCSTAGIAARICGDLVLNGYDDWYLPSQDELVKLYINRAAIGGFPISLPVYWSSSEFNGFSARWVFIGGCVSGLGPDVPCQGLNSKEVTYRVRAVRSF